MIADSVTFLRKHFEEVIYDAEHFFDGYKEHPSYALRSVQAAREGGAQTLVLCDTNGGSLPTEITEIIDAVTSKVHAPLGIHTHNDSDLAVANAIARAVGVRITELPMTPERVWRAIEERPHITSKEVVR
jgi:2-isopropylmalate synthase